MKIRPVPGGEYEWLRNNYPVQIEYQAVTYPSVEHAFVASRTYDTFMRQAIARCNVGSLSLYQGKLKPRPNWDEDRFGILRSLLFQKFSRYQDLRKKLLATERDYIEYSTDNTWGVGRNGYGRNLMGKMLMVTRAELRDPTALARYREKWLREAAILAEAQERARSVQ